MAEDGDLGCWPPFLHLDGRGVGVQSAGFHQLL